MSLKEFDLAKLMEQQLVFSICTLGEGPRLEGTLADARGKLEMIERAPLDLMEWADLALLAMEGAQRQGFEPIEVVAAIITAQAMKEQCGMQVIDFQRVSTIVTGSTQES